VFLRGQVVSLLGQDHRALGLDALCPSLLVQVLGLKLGQATGWGLRPSRQLKSGSDQCEQSDEERSVDCMVVHGDGVQRQQHQNALRALSRIEVWPLRSTMGLRAALPRKRVDSRRPKAVQSSEMR
jgi:hypothetical protein